MMDDEPGLLACSRRRMLGVAAAAMVASAAFPAHAAFPRTAERALAFENLHTGETLHTVYWAEGRYVPGALREIDHVLRDHRTGEVLPIDTALMDLLYSLNRRLESDAPFGVISGYRSPATNARLRQAGGGVAVHSLHTVGRAIDIRLPGRRLTDLRDAALALRAGGVGYYPRSAFVHVDTGRIRSW